jgi:ribonuclease Y
MELPELLLAQAPVWQILVQSVIFVVIGAVAMKGIDLYLERSAKAEREAEAERTLGVARQRAEEAVRAAEIEAKKIYLESQQQFERDTAETREELKTAERRLAKREDNIDKKIDVLDTKERKLEQTAQEIEDARQEIKQDRARVDEMLEQQREELLRISNLTPDQARDLCLKRLEESLEREAGQMTERILTEAEENARSRAAKSPSPRSNAMPLSTPPRPPSLRSMSPRTISKAA